LFVEILGYHPIDHAISNSAHSAGSLGHAGFACEAGFKLGYALVEKGVPFGEAEIDDGGAEGKRDGALTYIGGQYQFVSDGREEQFFIEFLRKKRVNFNDSILFELLLQKFAFNELNLEESR
jgi:hypothetical protein